MDIKNAQLFVNGSGYSYYRMKYAEHVATDYSLIENNYNDIALGLSNESSMTREEVDIKVIAFIIKSKLTMEE